MREYELLTVAVIHRHLAPVVDAHLAALGFASPKPLHWVRSSTAPVRAMFRYAQLKGGTLAPLWGYSLDFVPHLSGGKLRWHHTAKSAFLDAFVDGQLHGVNLTYIWGAAGLLDDMETRVASAIAEAALFWTKGTTPHAVFAQVAELRGQPGSQFYTQLPLATALCHAYAGREADGRREMEYFIATREPRAETVPRLWQLFARALEGYPGGRAPQ